MEKCPSPEGLSGKHFSGLYALLARPATSLSIRECEDMLDSLLGIIFGPSGSKSIHSAVFLTRCLSCCPYSCWEEVLHVITSINFNVYLSINQSESYYILWVLVLLLNLHCSMLLVVRKTTSLATMKEFEKSSKRIDNVKIGLRCCERRSVTRTCVFR